MDFISFICEHSLSNSKVYKVLYRYSFIKSMLHVEKLEAATL